MENDPELRSKFTEEQLKDNEAGRTPTGQCKASQRRAGKMQLVKREDHDRAIWWRSAYRWKFTLGCR
ncbi:MAG: HNH endonuclease [Enterocloster sp.]